MNNNTINSIFSDVAGAIRDIKGTTTKYSPVGFADELNFSGIVFNKKDFALSTTEPDASKYKYWFETDATEGIEVVNERQGGYQLDKKIKLSTLEYGPKPSDTVALSPQNKPQLYNGRIYYVTEENNVALYSGEPVIQDELYLVRDVRTEISVDQLTGRTRGFSVSDIIDGYCYIAACGASLGNSMYAPYLAKYNIASKEYTVIDNFCNTNQFRAYSHPNVIYEKVDNKDYVYLIESVSVSAWTYGYTLTSNASIIENNVCTSYQFTSSGIDSSLYSYNVIKAYETDNYIIYRFLKDNDNHYFKINKSGRLNSRVYKFSNVKGRLILGSNGIYDYENDNNSIFKIYKLGLSNERTLIDTFKFALSCNKPLYYDESTGTLKVYDSNVSIKSSVDANYRSVDSTDFYYIDFNNQTEFTEDSYVLKENIDSTNKILLVTADWAKDYIDLDNISIPVMSLVSNKQYINGYRSNGSTWDEMRFMH